MAPDRGFSPPEAQNNESAPPIPTFDIRSPSSAGPSPTNPEPFPSKSFTRTRSDFGAFLQTSQSHASATTGTNFTFRGVIVGALIGILICFSNTYFGLQTGWISGMAMPSALIGFAAFKTLSKHLQLPFSPVENVLVQTVAGAVGTMPLGCGFVGVIPALEFLLKKSEGAPIDLGLWKLIVWSLGICLFGVVFAVPLRKEVIVRERLKFPSGTATALMIGVLHGGFEKEKSYSTEDQNEHAHAGGEEQDALLSRQDSIEISREPAIDHTSDEHDERDNWKSQIRFMVMAFGVSAFYTLFSYFFPVLRDLPVFGYPLAYKWLWTLNPSPAYVGQGIIMGPATTLHMFLGALVGWAVLSPVAKHRGWAAGKVDDWENGSKGWIVWVSLAIMLADAIVNLGWLVLKASLEFGPSWSRAIQRTYKERSWEKFLPFPRHPWQHQYFLLPPNIASEPSTPMTPQAQSIKSQGEDYPPDDAPPQHLVSTTTVLILLPLTILFCIFCIHFTFGSLIPISLIILSVILALVLSVMGVRALGETDLNPVSGISKLTQLLFALATPSSLSHYAVPINLLAGAVSESGALQAGDMMQDLKTGHLLNASPKAQFYGQLIGSVIGAVISALVYRMYVSVYKIPGGQFEVPTGYVWIFTARLVTGKGLPERVDVFAAGAAAIWALITMLRIYTSPATARDGEPGWRQKIHPLLPGGIAVAVGMYNTPSFTLARMAGGLISWYWVSWRGKGETDVIVLASGLILGEGVVSIVNLVLASAGVPHYSR